MLLQFPKYYKFKYFTSSPVKNTNISPGSSYACILIVVLMAASK